MRSRTNYTVSRAQVYDHVAGVVHRHLGLRDHGYKCQLSVLLSVLFFAAARISSIFDACRRLREAPSDEAVRQALRAMLPERVELERRLNRALRDKLPKSLLNKSRPLALDLTELPYHGQPHDDPREVCRGKPKHGTTHFHAYATLYVVRRGERFTVAMTCVWQGEALKDIVQRLLQQARAAGVKPRYVLLDRAFYSLDVVRYLQAARCAFVMPVVHRGRNPKRTPLHQVRGTRRFLTWKKSGWSTHTLRNKKRTARVNIAVVHNQPPARGKRRRRRTLVYAFWGFCPPAPRWVADTYRRRFGIETSYRQMNQARIRTCTRDPVLRLFLVGIALLLRNAWVWIHRMLLGRVRGDGVELHLELLRFRTLLLLLQRYAESVLGCTEPLGPPGLETLR